MFSFELTPATSAAPKTAWPSGSQLVRDQDRPTLVMFLHPHCPCSRASLAELNILASHCRDRVALKIVFVRPAEFGDGWERTDLFATAQRIGGASVSCDREGLEAARFGATTSGETLLFGADGRLLFHGGLTPSRGHEGDSLGRNAAIALIDTGRADVSRTPVYGCALANQRGPNEEPEAR